jgi:hypothetical protein
MTAKPAPQPLKLVSNPDAEAPETVPLFYIDGVEYRARTSVPFKVSLRANRIFAEKGQEEAEMWAIIQVIGQEAWEALENFDELTEEDFQEIVTYVQAVVNPGKSQQNRAARRASVQRKASASR